jgi:hypothetical protein
LIKGIAYTGDGIISKVELSFDEGLSWVDTKIYSDNIKEYAWTSWEYVWNADKKGEYVIMARAMDTCRRVQPNEAEWNRKGYGYNAVTKVKVKVE